MNLRTKLWLGTGLLYILTLTVVGLSLRSVQRLSSSGTHLLRENYQSLVYMHRLDSMLTILEGQAEIGPAQQTQLTQTVALQRSNITEPDELRATDSLSAKVGQFLAFPHPSPAHLAALRRAMLEVERINQQALSSKSARAEALSESAMKEAIMLATLVLLVVFTLAINFPNVFIRPLEQLTKAVRQVGEGSYGTQVEVTDPKDELGQLGLAFNVMSAELARYQASNLEKVLQAQRRTESIINRLHEPLIVSDAEYRVLFFNQAARKVLGTEQQELSGSGLPELARRNELLASWMRSMEVPNPQPLSIVVSGRERFFTMEAFPIGEGDSLLGYVYSMTDVTQFKELDRARADLLATVAHELKTPISTINLSVRLLASGKPGPLSDGQTQLLSGISLEGGRLLMLVNSLLELSRTEIAAQVERIGEAGPALSLSAFLDSLEAKYATLAADKRLDIQISSPDTDQSLQTDAHKLELILSNLLSNAIRFAPAENGVVRLWVEKKPASLVFIVEDNGPGIPEPEKELVFERFYKGANGGTGLGLYIARELARQLQAGIALENGSDAGVRFVLTVPIQNA